LSEYFEIIKIVSILPNIEFNLDQKEKIDDLIEKTIKDEIEAASKLSPIYIFRKVDGRSRHRIRNTNRILR
jgi:hypothetical protein